MCETSESPVRFTFWQREREPHLLVGRGGHDRRQNLRQPPGPALGGRGQKFPVAQSQPDGQRAGVERSRTPEAPQIRRAELELALELTPVARGMLGEPGPVIV